MSETPAAEGLATPQGFPIQSPTSPAEGGEFLAKDEQNKVKINPGKDLWENISVNVKDSSGEQTDQTILIVGAPESGKTSLIHRMLGQNSQVKPTTALEYSYGKREERNATQIAHFWELAQGIELSQLSDVVITAENIHSVMLAIVVDCKNPGTMFETVNYWLKRIDRRVQEIFQKMRAKSSSTPDKLLKSMRKSIGEDHPDLAKMRLSGIPTVIIANRLDLFKDSTMKLKTMVRTLRFMAHIHGCSIVFTSEQEREAHKLRALLNTMIFKAPFTLSHIEMDHEKGGVLIVAGKDMFDNIGEPDHASTEGFQPCGDAELDSWKAPMDKMFPPKPLSSQGSVDSQNEFITALYDTQKGYGESAVDAMRKQKDEELEHYRKSVLKKASEKEKDNQ